MKRKKTIKLTITAFEVSCLDWMQATYPKVQTASDAMTAATAQEAVQRIKETYAKTP